MCPFLCGLKIVVVVNVVAVPDATTGESQTFFLLLIFLCHRMYPELPSVKLTVGFWQSCPILVVVYPPFSWASLYSPTWPLSKSLVHTFDNIMSNFLTDQFLLCVSGSCAGTTHQRSSSTCRLLCWASACFSFLTLGSHPSLTTACASPLRLFSTIFCWLPSHGWAWRLCTCTWPWLKSSTSMCLRTYSSSVQLDGVRVILLVWYVALSTNSNLLSCSYLFSSRRSKSLLHSCQLCNDLPKCIVYVLALLTATVLKTRKKWISKECSATKTELVSSYKRSGWW